MPLPPFWQRSSPHSILPRQLSTSFVTATQTQTIAPAPTNADVEKFVLTIPVIISDFPPNAPRPFVPSYKPLRDGSLITSLFVEDFVSDKTRLVIFGILLMLFVRNIIAALSYLRRVRVKDKTLFYLLLGSQLCGPLSVGASLAPFFIQETSCNLVNIFSLVMVGISYTLLIPGILAFKAYRYLDRPRFILIVVTALHGASVGLFVSDLPNLNSSRRATGSCTASGRLDRIVIAVLLLLAEVFFICFCFVYAVWRGSRYPEARGRISIRMSVSRTLSTVAPLAIGEKDAEGRGWWDYVPQGTIASDTVSKSSESTRSRDEQRPGKFIRIIMHLFGDQDLVDQPYVRRKPSVHSINPLKSDKSKNRMSWRAWGRMLKLPSAMKDELVYTTAIAVLFGVSVIIVVAGAFDSDLLGGPWTWAGLSWASTSLLMMHSFSRVVRRNEREMTLQEPAAWNPMQATNEGLNSTLPPRGIGSPAMSRYLTTRGFVGQRPLHNDVGRRPSQISLGGASENPFADFEFRVPRSQVESWQPMVDTEGIVGAKFPQSTRSSVSAYSESASFPRENTR